TFYENLPANQLELALFLEADRMRGIKLTQAGLATARGVLLEERASHFGSPTARHQARLEELSFENFANQRADYATAQQFERLTIGDVVNYHRTRFTPRNAALALVGEFDTAKARQLIGKYFGSIPAPPAPPSPDLREKQRSAERRETVLDATSQSPAVL